MKTVTNFKGDETNKVDDTSTVLSFILWNDGVPQNFESNKIVATVANSNGYLFQVDLKADGYKVLLDFSNESLQKLVADDYSFEISVTDHSGENEIYPTVGSVPFVVTKNLNTSDDSLIPIVTFDALLRSVDKKIADYLGTVAKGEKGDKGIQGDNGLVSNQLTTSNLNTVISDVDSYIGNWFVTVDTSTGGLNNGYPSKNIGTWVLQVTSFGDNSGLIKANLNDSNENYIGAIKNGALVNWVNVQSIDDNYVFNSDVTINGAIKANSITSTSGNYTVKTDYMGDF